MASCRFAFAVHILAVLAYRAGAGVNSARLSQSLNTNPVVVRRLLSELRKAGLVVTQKGANGGAKLSRRPEEIRLSDVYDAVSEAPRFSRHPNPPNPRCPVGCRIEEVLTEVFTSAHSALQEALGRRTLAEVLETVIEQDAAASSAALV